MERHFDEEIINYLGKYEGFLTHFILDVSEGFNVIGEVQNMRLGNCSDKDIAFDKGITIHSFQQINQFNFSDKNIIDLIFREAYDETSNDTIIVLYQSGTCLTFWFENR